MINGDMFDELDPLLQHKLRFGACVLLSRNDALSFANLKESLSATDGNLGAQLNKLEKEGYVSITKEFVNRKPVTWYSLTDRGQGGLDAHLNAFQQVIQSLDSKTTQQ